MNGPTFYRIAQLASTRDKPGIVPLSASTIWRRAKDGSFPAPVKMSVRVVAWRESDVQAWLRNPQQAPAPDDGANEGAIPVSP